MRFAPARRRGYAKRYLRHQLGQHGVELLLAAAFLLGVLLGCQMTSEENTRLVEQLNGLLSAQQGSFLMQVVSSFAAVAALLLILFLSGLGAVFQPLVPLVLFWRGMGLVHWVFAPMPPDSHPTASTTCWCFFHGRWGRCCC